MKYQTMTVGGLYGGSFEAQSDEEAQTAAEAANYEVLDIIDADDSDADDSDADFILVVA